MSLFAEKGTKAHLFEWNEPRSLHSQLCPCFKITFCFGITFRKVAGTVQRVPVPFTQLPLNANYITWFSSVQFSSVAQSCPTLCDPMNRSTPGLPVHHQLLEFTQTHVHRVSDAIQPSHPLSSPSPAPNASQHQSLFQGVNASHKALEFQL